MENITLLDEIAANVDDTLNINEVAKRMNMVLVTLKCETVRHSTAQVLEDIGLFVVDIQYVSTAVCNDDYDLAKHLESYPTKVWVLPTKVVRDIKKITSDEWVFARWLDRVIGDTIADVESIKSAFMIEW
jgi:hypothetical protein